MCHYYMVKHDDYMTPFSAWADVSPYIPRHLTLWEAFYGDGTSGHHLTGGHTWSVATKDCPDS